MGLQYNRLQNIGIVHRVRVRLSFTPSVYLSARPYPPSNARSKSENRRKRGYRLSYHVYFIDYCARLCARPVAGRTTARTTAHTLGRTSHWRACTWHTVDMGTSPFRIPYDLTHNRGQSSVVSPLSTPCKCAGAGPNPGPRKPYNRRYASIVRVPNSRVILIWIMPGLNVSIAVLSMCSMRIEMLHRGGGASNAHASEAGLCVLGEGHRLPSSRGAASSQRRRRPP